MYVIHEPLRNKPKCRVELHIHLDGAIRPETIWEVMRKKNLKLPEDGSIDSLKKNLEVREPQDLLFFLKGFSIFLPAFKGDLEAIERFSFEFVEDQAEQSVAYCEARFCPHLFLPDVALPAVYTKGIPEAIAIPSYNGSVVDARQVLEACLKGIKKGEEKFGTKVRLVLFCILGKIEWSLELLKLCEDFQNDGVVGIDIVVNENFAEDDQNAEEIQVFEAAKAKGIHRTIHAGEDSGWESVQKAITKLGAERIGHGYRVIENEEFYQRCLDDRVHFEMCPHSSYLTGSISGLCLTSKRHPILRLAEDGASFSINSDNPTVTGTRVGEEYELLRSWGFTEALFTRANFEAAYKCFLPVDEKQELLSNLREAYGIILPEAVTPESSPSDTPNKVPSSPRKPAVKIASWEDRSF